jgi:hypothetical protein
MTPLLAVETPLMAPGQQPGLIRTAGAAQDLLIVLGAGVGVLVLLIIWAVYLRRRSRHHSSHHSSHHRHHHRSEPAPTEAAASEEETTPHHHHRQRRQKREHRGRNPTLAETGGLPPPRPEGTPPTVM